MNNEIPIRYNPKETEDKWYGIWEKNGYFRAKPDSSKKPFCIVIPPPNVTGILHMGHALNNSIQDILIRYHRMKGEESLWMPGTDHAGIATQNVAEKKLAREGLRRQDLGREKFIEKVWEWREEYGTTIIKQLKKLGASCEWERTRFTMDEEYSQAVAEAFIQLYEKGLIYRGSYIINWCPRCQTALSDEEAPHRELDGNLYYLKYPLKDNPEEFICVATTRPETMLGDTAVAVNPKDKRYKKYLGKTLILPLVNREIKIISDPLIDPKFGTGAVKVTPAHDPNDYQMGKKHNLEFINIMHPDAKMNENAGDYRDMDRFEARQVILEDLKEKGLLEKVEPYKVSAGHCYRCHTIIEPYLSKQWFVKMKPLAGPAIEAVKKGKIKFYPKRWTKVYLNWMENIQDWCISRQIWWGHRIPVYYCRKCIGQSTGHGQQPTAKYPGSADNRTQKGVIVSKVKPDKCPACGNADMRQDEDVLDTWFSSWLWPFATFCWPKKNEDLGYFYPTQTLVTAPEIIFFWVARMIMAGFEFMGEAPFKDVYIHGTVRDIEGKKMSKSLGNIIDPLEIINEYGSDALRFSIISITAQGQDVYLSKERFEQGRNFANKIWNASRLIIMNLEPQLLKKDLCVFFKEEGLSLENRWILSRFYSTLKDINKYLDTYRFNEAAGCLYRFFWHEFCDWYLEMIKSDIKNADNQMVMFKVLEKFLRVMHPFMPFITEEIWQKIPHDGQTIMKEPWPHIQEEIIDKKSERRMEMLFEISTAIRNMRCEIDIPAQAQVKTIISCHDKAQRELISTLENHIKNMTRSEQITITDKFTKPSSAITSVSGNLHISILLEGLIDIDKEKEKLENKIKKAESDIKAKKKMLENEQFASKAPQEIIAKERAKLEEMTETLKKLKVVKDGLK